MDAAPGNLRRAAGDHIMLVKAETVDRSAGSSVAGSERCAMTDDARIAMEAGRRLAERPLPRRESVGIEDSRAVLSVERILSWADAHHGAHGVWPSVGPGTVSGVVAGGAWRVVEGDQPRTGAGATAASREAGHLRIYWPSTAVSGTSGHGPD